MGATGEDEAEAVWEDREDEVHRGEDGAATRRAATQEDTASVRPAATLAATARL